MVKTYCDRPLKMGWHPHMMKNSSISSTLLHWKKIFFPAQNEKFFIRICMTKLVKGKRNCIFLFCFGSFAILCFKNYAWLIANVLSKEMNVLYINPKENKSMREREVSFSLRFLLFFLASFFPNTGRLR